MRSMSTRDPVTPLDTPATSTSELVRTYRRVFGAFGSRVAVEPTIDAMLEVADALCGRPVVLTDAEGTVINSSRPIGTDIDLRPGPAADLVSIPVRSGSTLCVTSVILPGRVFAWILGDVPEDDLVSQFVVMFAAEYGTTLERFAFPSIPEVWIQRARLVRMMVGAAPRDRVGELARVLDHDIEQTHHVVVMESLAEMDGTRLSWSIGSRTRDFAIIAPVGRQVIVVVAGAARLNGLLDSLRLATDIGGLRIGVSSAAGDGFDLSHALDQAVTACNDIAPDIGETTISWFDDRDPVTIMLRSTDAATVDRFVVDALGPLLDYNGPHRDEFLETLRVWLDSTESLDRIAEQLHIHRSTLVYRLRRIRELLGHDLRDPEKRFEMSLALRLFANPSVDHLSHPN